MPFVSKDQLRTCYYKKYTSNSKWDCDEFLKATKNPSCLPQSKALKGTKSSKCRPLRKGEEWKSPLYRGPKGGYYFWAKNVKVYVPKSARDKAIKDLGKAF